MNDHRSQQSRGTSLFAATLTSALLLVGADSTLAQGQGGGMEPADLQEMIEALQIREDQEEAFRAAMEEIRSDRQNAMRGQGQGQGQGQGHDSSNERAQERRGGARGEQMRDGAGRGQRGQNADDGHGGQGQGGGMGRERMQERQQRAEGILSEVLTDEQMNRFRDYRRERMQDMRQQRQQQRDGQ